MATRRGAIILVIAMAVAVGCGSDGGDTDRTHVPAARDLTGTYDTRVVLDGVEVAATAALVAVGGFDGQQLVIIDFPTGALETIHLQGSVAADGTLDLIGQEAHPDRVLSVTGAMRTSADQKSIRIDGTIGTIAGFLAVSLNRPVQSPAHRPAGGFVLTFEPSVANSGPSSQVAAAIEVSDCCCSVSGGPEMPDRVGGVLFGGTCALAPSGAFWFHSRFRTAVPDTSPFGEDFQLLGTLRTTATGIVGGGSFGLERFPPNADVFGAWRARGD